MDCSLSEGPSRYLDALYEEYDQFDVQQTTVGVDSDEFAVLEERPEGVSIRIEVEGEKGVLVFPDSDGWALPGGVVDTDLDRESIVDFLERRSGVRCAIDDLTRLSLVCLQCSETDEELWTASALFSATPIDGRPRGEAVWRDRSTPILTPPSP